VTQTVVAANKAALNMVGASKEQLVGKTYHTICSELKGKCTIADQNQTTNWEEQALTKLNGRQIPVFKAAKKVVLSGQEYIVESFVDVGKRNLTSRKTMKSICSFRFCLR
jgi:hypothetical protein